MSSIRFLIALPISLFLSGCSVIATAATGAFIVGPILSMVFIVACIWMLVKLITGSSSRKLEQQRINDQRLNEERIYRMMQEKNNPPPPAYIPTLPTHNQQTLPPPRVREVQECPFCKEEILVGAVICKHCRSSL